MKEPHVLVALVATLITVPTARADDTYKFRSEFLANVPDAAVTYDFEQASGFPAAVAPISTFGGGGAIQVSSVGGSAFVENYFAPNQGLTGGLNGALNELQPIHFVFAEPVFGVGFDDMALTPQLTEVAVIKITRADNSTGTFITGNVEDVITPVFFGVISPLGIVALDVYSGSAPNSPPGGRANLIDNLVVSAAVPEPAGVAAAAGGLMALSRRRRRPGNEGQGIGGGIYINYINAAADAGLDTFTVRNTTGNTASTSSPNIAGSYRRLR
jgi:hypothetical protein